MDSDTADVAVNITKIIGDKSMPRGDRKGPNGSGPMTGRKAGYCSGSGRPGYMNSGNDKESPRLFGRRGSGIGRGTGAGYRRNYDGVSHSDTFADDQNSEKQFLEREIAVLKNQVKALGQKLTMKDKEA